MRSDKIVKEHKQANEIISWVERIEALFSFVPSFELVVKGLNNICLLYTSDAADDLLCVDLGVRRIIKKKNFLY